MLRFLTSGESHGQTLIAILDGVPAGLEVDVEKLNAELRRRQQGYGRGARQKIETDAVDIVGGLRHGITSGAPLGLLVRNRDWDNWRHVMSVTAVDFNDPAVKEQVAKKKIGRFRPGHADLAGTLKFRQRDIRDVLERASARETAARVAVGALCEQLLARFGVHSAAHVLQVASVRSSLDIANLPIQTIEERVQSSEMFCVDDKATELMKSTIKAAWQEGDSLGGVVEVLIEGLPVGLGSYTQWDEKLDGQIAQAVMSVHAIKACEIGDGVEAAGLPGSQVHDAIHPNSSNSNGLPFIRKTNHAGGLEGGMTNGSRLRVRGYMKPIPTLRKGLPSVSFPEFAADTAHYERSDVCAVPAACVVVKAMVNFVVARSLLSKFGGDTVTDLEQAVRFFKEHCQSASAQTKVPALVGQGDDAAPEMELE